MPETTTHPSPPAGAKTEPLRALVFRSRNAFAVSLGGSTVTTRETALGALTYLGEVAKASRRRVVAEVHERSGIKHYQVDNTGDFKVVAAPRTRRDLGLADPEAGAEWAESHLFGR